MLCLRNLGCRVETSINNEALKKAVMVWEGDRFSISSLEKSIMCYLNHTEKENKNKIFLEMLLEAESILTMAMTILSMNKSALYENEIKLISRGEEFVQKIAKATA